MDGWMARYMYIRDTVPNSNYYIARHALNHHRFFKLVEKETCAIHIIRVY